MPGKHESKSQTMKPFDFAPAWRPDQNDDPTLEGIMSDLDEGYSEFGGYPIVTIEVQLNNGDLDYRAWHAMSTVAKSQLVKANPKIGERLRISYGGKVQGKNESREPYTRWRVENLTHPITAQSILDKYATEVPRSGNFDDDPPF